MVFKKLSCLILFSFIPSLVFADVSATQQTGSQDAQHQLELRNENLRQRVEQNLPNGEIQREIAPGLSGNSQKILINTIIVQGNTLLSNGEIDAIIKPFEGKMLSLPDMQEVADLLSNAYRKKGFVTTQVVLSPQKITDNALLLTVVQGVTGNIIVEGNRFSKKEAYLRKMELKKGNPFNYYILRKDLAVINQYPDHYVKAVLVPGEGPGQTDVVLQVQDHLPLHLDLSYDNFASKYIGKNEYTGTFRDDNLLGFDDILTVGYEGSNDYAYRLSSVSYVLPVTNSTQIGIAASQNQVVLQKELKDINARGKSKIYSAFVNQTLVNDPNLLITANAGFDYKDVFNFELGNETSRDRLRIAKTGFNVDYTDEFNGRNIFTNEFFQGIPDIMAGSWAKDPDSSVAGAGGEFSKDVVDLLRSQALPWDMSILLKAESQFAGDTLPAIEEYQLGGIANNRGFGPEEAVGDSGQSATAELNIPPYFIPPSIRVPFSGTRLYDATRFVAFYDWGHVNLRNPQAGEPENRSLGSTGGGVRFNLPQDLSLRVEVGWPVQGVSSDGDQAHLWIQVTKEF